jgi:hypothetical protein
MLATFAAHFIAAVSAGKVDGALLMDLCTLKTVAPIWTAM